MPPKHEPLVGKVLTLRASSVGDALMGKYFLENVHAAYPKARCFLLVGSRADMIRDLLLGYPWMTVIEANRKDPRSLLRAWDKLKGADITLTQYAERPFSTPSKIFARLVTRPGGFLGFSDSWWGNRFLYDHVLPFAGEDKSKGMILEEEKALSAMDIKPSVQELTLQFSKESPAPSDFSLPNVYVIVHLFSGSQGRGISDSKRRKLLEALRNFLPRTVSILVTGGEGDTAQARTACKGLEGCTILAGRATWQSFMRIVSNARAVVSVDTGGAHIAAHLKVPLVVLTRTAAREAWWGGAMYGGRPIVLCNERADDGAPRQTPHPPSLETIPEHEVISALQRIIGPS